MGVLLSGSAMAAQTKGVAGGNTRCVRADRAPGDPAGTLLVIIQYPGASHAQS
nr:hypothetical protein JVH1_0850 [Rhodococcus sp. JVH1]